MSFADFVAREPALAGVLAPSPYIALVGDPATGARYPYGTDRRDPTVFLDQQALAADRAALDAAAAQFASRGYAVVPPLLPAAQLAALRDYYRGLVEEGYAARQDGQVERRSVLHNEPLMTYYHRELCRAFAHVAATAIKPSYGYFAAYRRGALLEKHCDREQCKFTASLLLDYAAGPADAPAWPLYLELPATEEVVSVELAPGECVLFCGQVQPHHRRALHAEQSTSLLFHYVDETFPGPLQ
jgi:hypothetical protein